MEKLAIVAIVAAMLLVFGAVFVVAGNEQKEEQKEYAEVIDSAEICGPATCGGRCSGGCGIPACTCGG